MSRYSFSLSPAYVARGVQNAPETLAIERSQVPAWTLLSAVMLASMIFSLVWLG